MKLTPNQSTILRVIAEASKSLDTNERLPWYARSEVYLENRKLYFEADNLRPVLAALQRKGLIQAYPRLGEYSQIITDLGLQVAAGERGKPILYISAMDQERIKERNQRD
jgi:hypothetical protein